MYFRNYQTIRSGFLAVTVYDKTAKYNLGRVKRLDNRVAVITQNVKMHAVPTTTFTMNPYVCTLNRLCNHLSFYLRFSLNYETSLFSSNKC